MEGGYLLNLNNSQFERLVGKAINISIYGGPGYEEYCSKANKMRELWDKESDSVIGLLMESLLDYYELYAKRQKKNPEEYQMQLKELRVVVNRLNGTDLHFELPENIEESLQTLLEDINHSVTQNKPTLVLDRIHTYASKVLRKACYENGIKVVSENGKNLPLHSLAGMLGKFYERENVIESAFTLIALKQSISLFEKYNEIRNDKSFAHDNEILNVAEAEYVVKAMVNLLKFVNQIEDIRKADKENNPFED